MSKLHLLKNQVTYKGDMVKRIVIEPATNLPRPVYRADRTNGKSPEVGTYQSVKEGDYVVTYRACDTHLSFAIIDAQGKPEPVEEGFNYYPIVQSLTALITEWLYSEISLPFLPKGVGWDGMNPLIEKIKVEKALSSLPRAMPSKLLARLTHAIGFTSLSAFNDIGTTYLSKKDILDLPACDIYIQANESGEYIRHDEPEGGHDYITTSIEDNCKFVYIICLQPLPNSAAHKIAVEIIELS